jgi:predicted secreted protein
MEVEKAPIIYEGTSYLPIKSIGEITGFETKWDEKTHTIEMQRRKEEQKHAVSLENNLHMNEVLSVTLDENITTGFEWDYVIEDESIFQILSEEQIKPNSQGDEQVKKRVGAGSKHIWNFTAQKEGKTKITFYYYRNWEGKDSTEKIIEYDVTVLPDKENIQ